MKVKKKVMNLKPVKVLLNLWNKIRNRVSGLLKNPAEFLKNGRIGGNISCLILAVQFLYSAAFPYGETLIGKTVFVLVEALALFLAIELLRLLLSLLFGQVRRGRIYFLASWAVLFLCNYAANQGYDLFPAVLVTFTVSLAVDLLGRCIASLIRKHEKLPGFAYGCLAVSLVIVCGFGAFYRLDCFGEDRIRGYLSADSVCSETVPGFGDYLRNGEETVCFLEYGTDEGSDIVTHTIDLSAIADETGIGYWFDKWVSGYSPEETAIKGAVWYPENPENCPVLFFVHGNHDYRTDSYLGYDYLGEYLASNGYVVVSVDENSINALGNGNDMRAVLLLENIKEILKQNADPASPLYGKIDADRIVIGGHSRGGEMAATAYAFNDLSSYPENGNLTFDYHFNISGVIAVSPTVDQYMPAGHAVELTDVNYLLLHGSNDQDVSDMMGEKQYHNVVFTGDTEEAYFKSSVYIMGANHGQFNSRWGSYDLNSGTNGFLNTCHFLADEDQKTIAKAYIRVFLDQVLCSETEYADLLEDNERYRSSLPETVYITNYRNSEETVLSSFDASIDTEKTDRDGERILCLDMEEWGLTEDIYGSGGEGENYVLFCDWEEDSEPQMEIDVRNLNLENRTVSLRIRDMREDSPDRVEPLTFTMEFEDINGNLVSGEKSIYPSLAVQLYKEDVLFGSYEYKHQMQTVTFSTDSLNGSENFNAGAVRFIRLYFDGSENGSVVLDDITYRD